MSPSPLDRPSGEDPAAAIRESAATDLTRGRWQRVQEAMHASLELPARERRAYLDRIFASDPELRREVESLLEAHDSASLLDEPAAELIAPLAAELSLARHRTALPGPTVSRYQILEKLGSGGMGVVYRARDPRLGRAVALKFLPPHLSSDEHAKRRFLMEAQAVAALDHPNICVIHEIGETEDGQLFLAMPFYEGETLKQRIARGPLPPDEALAVAIRTARALAAAHARGLVHRDVKPANLIMTRDGTVKLLDFGIAKLADVSATGPGTTPGTVAYMSPEQASGAAVDHRADLWSLGVVLYEMLAGERPFRGEHEQVVLHAILHGDHEPVTSRRADVDPALARIIGRALARRPDDRYATAADLLQDLEDVQQGKVRGSLRGVLSSRARAIALLGIGVLVAGVGFAVASRDAPPDASAASGAEGGIQHPAGNPVAHDLVLRARGLVGRGEKENQTAVDLLQQALRLDASFADAYSALSGAYLQRVQLYGYPGEWADSGIAMARTALRLDPQLAPGHSALGANLVHLGRFEEAAVAYQRALDLNPGYVAAMNNLGALARKRGRHDEALH